MGLAGKNRLYQRIRRSPSVLTLGFILALILTSSPSRANPDGGVVVGGQANIQNSVNRVDIHQMTDRAVIDWRGFDIGPNETTQFHQPGATSIALNRVKNSTAPSRIDGFLKANGNVVIVNQNGVLFGQGAKVDVNGLVATSADIDNDRFLNDRVPHFNKPGSRDAIIKNDGEITAREAGLVGFVAPQVENNGVIQARLGRVQLSSGETTTIDFYGDGLLEIGIGNASHAQSVKNTGTLKADGGVVAMTAQTGAKVLGAAIEQRGIIQAQTVQQKNGRVIIGALGRNAVKGNIVADKGKADVAETSVTVTGKIDVSGRNVGEKGGSVEVLGDHITLTQTTRIDARGSAGGGNVKVGGDYLGLGSTPVAKTLNIAEAAEIDASAIIQGHGGRVIAFADGFTIFDGIIRANGAGVRGDGGFIETSGKSVLWVDKGWAEARGSEGGKAGEWLLDPADLTIDNTNPTNLVTGATPFIPNATGGSFLRTTTIIPLLDAGTNIVVQTNNDAFTGNGDIFVNAPITTTGSGALTLSAFRNINIATGSAITLQAGALTLRSNNTGAAGGGAIDINSALTTAGGSITIGGGSGAITAASYNANGSVNVAATNYAQGNSVLPIGVRINAAINGGGGNIIINGRGENAAGNSIGIEQTAGSAISTTGAGTIRMSGIAQGTLGNTNQTTGLALRHTVTAQNGVIELNGTAGSGTGGNTFGVLMSNAGGLVRTTGSGAITISGTGGSGNGTGGGVLVNFTGGISPTGTGSVLVFGTGGGAAAAGSKSGVVINSSGVGSIIGNGGAMTINGFGGTASASNNNYGIWLSGGGAGIGEVTNTGGSGSLQMNGTGGGTGASSGNHGIFVTGTGARATVFGAGAVTFTGNGGNTGGTGGINHGVYSNIANGLGSSGTSSITINGTRGGQTSSFGIITDVANGIRTTGAGTNITLSSDTFSLNTANNVVAPGTITVAPRTAITMGVGSGAGTLQFSDTFISYLSATTGYTFGSTTALSLDVNTAAAGLASRAISFISNASISINSVLNNLTSLATTAANGATNFNAVIGGVTPVGAITMSGQDLFINQNMTSTASITGSVTRDLTVAATSTVTTGAGANLSLLAASNLVTGTGNLTLNGILRVGTGNLSLSSGVNGTRPSWTATATNLVRLGANFGIVSIQGFLDTTISRDINSNNNVSITSFRDLTVSGGNTISTGGANSLSLRSANGNSLGTGVSNLNGILSVGTGSLTLISGLNPTRQSYSATTTNLVRSGATFGAIDIQGFNDFVVDRLLNSTVAINFSNNTRTVLRNNISSSGGAITLGNNVSVDEGFTSQITTTNQPINLNSAITGTLGGVAETLIVNPGTSTITVGSSGGIDGVNLDMNAGSIIFNAPIGAVTGLGATSLTSALSLTLPNITAATLSVNTTLANQSLLIGGSLTTTQATGGLSLSSAGNILKTGGGNFTSNNGVITMNAATNLMFASASSINSNGGAINLTGTSGIVNSASLSVNSSGGNVNVNSPLVLAAPLSFNLGTGNLAFAGTINGATPLSSVFDVLAVGGGGGGGGRDAGTNAAGGGSGGVIDTKVNTASGVYTILVGGGGGAGVSSLSSAAGGPGGVNGGGAGGVAGASGTSGGGGGGGGYSAIFIGGTYYAVAGGGAGGGGSNEGTANDVVAPGGGSQPNGNTGTMNGGVGGNFVGDGGGGAGGGGGFLGGNGQTNLTSSGQASAGSNYFNPINVSGSTLVGNNGQTNGGGAAGGAATAISGPRATFFAYGNNLGAGGTGNAVSTNGGNGTVIIRYTGTPGQVVAQGGTVTTSGGDTIVTYTSLTATNFFAPISSCSGSCNLSIDANAVTFGGAVGGTQALDNISITTAQTLTVPNMTVANSIFARSTSISADLVIPSSTILTANGTGNAVTLVAGRNFVNNSGASAIATPSGRYLVYSTNPTNDTVGGLANNFRRFSCSYNTSGSCSFNATLNNTVTIPAAGNGFLYRITPPFITITPTTLASVIYGNGVNLTGYAYNPLISGQYLSASDFAADVVTGSLNGSTTYSPGPVNGNVGTYGINYASGSLISQLGYGFTYANNSVGINVIQRTLTPSLVGLVSKTYDGNDGATLTGANYSLANIFGSDTVNISNISGIYNNKNVGVSKNLTVTGLTLGGAQAGNYVLSTTTVSNTVGQILQRALTVTTIASNKTYDGNDIASVILGDNRVGGDVLTLGFGSALFNNKNAGVSKPVNVTGITVTGTDAGNYSFNTTASTAANINQRALTVSATASNKTYDGNDIASVILGDNRVGGDVLILGFGSALFNNKNVGTAKPINVTGISVTGTDSGNYSFNITASTVANINQRALTVSATASNKTYDGNDIASVILGDNRVGGDVLILGFGSALFNNKNVGTAKPINVTGISVTGTDSGNYSFNTTASTAANINQRALTVSATASNKTYDGNDIASVILGDNRVGGDVLTLGFGSALFNNKNAGVSKPVNVTGITVTGTDAGNYSFNTTASTAANINQLALTISATGINKTYDGNDIASINLSDNRVTGDFLTLGYGSALFDNKNAGVSKPVNVTGIIVTGTDAGNYSFNTSASTVANINQRALTVSATANNKIYDGNDIASVILGDNRVGGDVLILGFGSALFNNKNAGVSKPVNVTGITVTGTDAGNYIFNTIDSTIATIFQRALTVSATGINKSYDGNTLASVTLSDNRVSGDVLVVGFGAANFVDANSGVAKPINVTGISVTGTDSSNYTFNINASTNASINKLIVTATAQDQNMTYGDAIPATSILYSGFITGEDPTFLVTLPTSTSLLSGLQNVGTYNGNYTVAGGVDNNYDFNYVAGRLIVNKKDLNISANNIFITYGDIVPAGTVSYSGFISGEDENDLLSLPTLSSALNGVQNVGTYINNYTLSGATSNNYNILYFSGNLSVAKKDLNVTVDNKTINFGISVPSGTYVINGFVNGDDDLDIDVLPIVSSALNGVQNTGTYTGNYTASGALDNNYNFLYTSGNLTVSAVGLNVTVNQKTITYGDFVPTTTITYTGFVNGDDETDLVTIPTIFSTLSGMQNAGTYTGNYTASGGVSPNYVFNYVSGDLVVNKKNLNVAAQNRIITYGTVIPTSTLDYSGFITGEDETNLVNIPVITSTLSGLQNAGTYNGNYTVAGGVSNNYNFIYSPGNLVITQKTLTVSASPQSIQYGTPVPIGALTYSGFISGEDETDLTSLPTVTSGLIGIQPVGTYINNYVVSGGSSNNYIFTYTPANLVIGKKLVIISAQNQTINYGTAVPTTTLVFNGFTAGEDENDLTTLPTISSNLNGIQNAGSYLGNYTVSGAASSNYNFQYNFGNLSINRIGLVVTANPISMTYGAGNNFSGFTPAGLVLGQTIGSVTLTSSAPLSSSNNWRAGTWAITPSAATGGTFNPANYNITYNAGTLDIAQLNLVLGASTLNKTYDGNNSTTTSLSDNRLTGDSLILGFGTALFDNKNVGVNKLVTVSGITVTGTDSSNYSLNSTVSTNANILQRALNVTVTGINKIFDGTTAANVIFGDNRITGDALTVGGSASFLDALVGNNKPVTVNGIFLSGPDGGNYSPNTTALTTASILANALPPPSVFVPKVPATVQWTSQNQFGGVLFLPDDGIYATPHEGYMLVYLPREAPELNRQRNRAVTSN